jgi:hypothetical protein
MPIAQSYILKPDQTLGSLLCELAFNMAFVNAALTLFALTLKVK